VAIHIMFRTFRLLLAFRHLIILKIQVVNNEHWINEGSIQRI
jgi:hypothetical protein